METTVNFTSVVDTCDQFMSKGKKEARKVVISPLKVTESSDGQIKLNTGCSMWKACENADCQFSVVAFGGLREPKLPR